jgi:pilus assembly protein Flp/PilA
MRTPPRLFRRLVTDRRGATAIEYGLIIALVVLAMMGALRGTASVTVGMWNNISNTVQEAR